MTDGQVSHTSAVRKALTLCVVTLVLAMSMAACAGGRPLDGHASRASTVVSTTATTFPAESTSPSTTLASPIPGACPPGCSLPSDYDAITVLASSAELVAIVTVQSPQAAYDEGATYATDKILQGDVVYGPGPEAYVAIGSPMIYGTSKVVDGKSYLVFVSFNRGGTCLSALFSYDSETTVATLIGSDAEFEAPRLPLAGGRVVVIPATITLAEVEQRMYPTSGPVYPTDSGESWCPGP